MLTANKILLVGIVCIILAAICEVTVLSGIAKGEMVLEINEHMTNLSNFDKEEVTFWLAMHGLNTTSGGMITLDGQTFNITEVDGKWRIA